MFLVDLLALAPHEAELAAALGPALTSDRVFKLGEPVLLLTLRLSRASASILGSAGLLLLHFMPVRFQGIWLAPELMATPCKCSHNGRLTSDCV